MINAIKKKLEIDLAKFGNQDWEDPPTDNESFFLDKVAKADLDEAEMSREFDKCLV